MDRSVVLQPRLCGLLLVCLCAFGGPSTTQRSLGQEPARPQWNYSPKLLQPFWLGDTVEGESVLFIRDEQTGEARASVLFPITQLIAVRNSVGDVTYQEGQDYQWKPESREIVIPKGSKIPTSVPRDLRRPEGTQKYRLTHRDGDGEIFYGGRLEYAEMQTCVTYQHAPVDWQDIIPRFNPNSLPRSVARLVNREPLGIVVLGDSISAGANASALYDAAPYQPAYPELVRRQLAERFKSRVELTNLAVGGTSSDWGLSQVEKIVEAKPQLVILAFGMNDSSGRSPESFGENIGKIITETRAKLPECEFILVASMLGNRDWITLKHEVFPQYRDQLLRLAGPGVAVADLTSLWTRFLELKKDWDQTGNGVNHPNDFGHRVYAQVITSLLDTHAASEAVDVFMNGTEGYFAYRIPALVTTKSGTLLAFCEGRRDSLSDDGDNDLVLRRSEDHGQTWQPLQVVHAEVGDQEITIGNPCPVIDPATGRIWLSMNRENRQVLLTFSDDDGKTWAPVRDITTSVSAKNWGWYAMGPGVGIAVERGPHRGRLILPANHRETADRSGPSSSHILYSDDHGATWQLGGTVGPHTNECQLVETINGEGSELLINMRNHWARSGKRPELAGRRLISRSQDGGLTWSEPTPDPQLIEPTCQASLIRYSWPGDSSASTLLFANPASPSKRANLTIRASFDEGKTWPRSRSIDAGPAAYSCLTRLADGRIGLLYERANYQRLTFVAVELNSLTPVSPSP
jgi:acyl-CoA thioesterase-1